MQRALVDRVGRVDRHIAELRDDPELTIRSELMGQPGHLRTQTKQSLDALAERVEALERRTPLSWTGFRNGLMQQP